MSFIAAHCGWDPKHKPVNSFVKDERIYTEIYGANGAAFNVYDLKKMRSKMRLNRNKRAYSMFDILDESLVGVYIPGVNDEEFGIAEETGLSRQDH